jgi:molecular chaperone GrpE
MKTQPANQETAEPAGEKEQEPQQPEQVQTTKVQDSQLQEMTDLLKRTQANFENYRKQTEKRMEEMQAFAARGMLLQLLPIIDNFELALKNTQSPEEFMKGMELIYSQFITVLADQDVQPMVTENQQYNPYLHEALLRVEAELPENKIIEEFQKGYLLAGKVLRHAKVKVSAGRKKG